MHQYFQSLSEKIAHKYARLFEKRQCYENVFKLVTGNIEELKPPSKLSVLFCYIPGAAGLYYRHALCLYNNRIVEPLLYLNMEEKDPADIVPIRLMTEREYLDLILADGKYDLSDVLRDDDIRAFNSSSIPLNPVDLSNMVASVTTSANEFLLVMHSAMNGKGIHPPDSILPESVDDIDYTEQENEDMEI